MKIPSSTPSFCQMESRGQQASNESLFHGRSREVEDGAVLLHIGSRSSIQWESSKVKLRIAPPFSTSAPGPQHAAPPTRGFTDCRGSFLLPPPRVPLLFPRRCRNRPPPSPLRFPTTNDVRQCSPVPIMSTHGLPRRRVPRN
jgi:hypothetical protein